MDGSTPDQVLRLQREIADIEDLADADPELGDAYEALLDERREALARLLRGADQGDRPAAAD